MIPALIGSRLCSLRAVASSRPFTGTYPAETRLYSGPGAYEALLNDSAVECVYLAFPNALHAEWAIRAMEHGKHVLCEKPLACTPEEGRGMAAAAKKNGVLLMEAFMYRYGGKFRALKKLLDEGVLGEIRGMQGNHGYVLDWASPAREDPALGGGSVYDVGCYVADAMNFVMRSAGASVSEAIGFLRESGGVDCHACFCLRYDNGVTASLESWFDAAQEQRLMLTGTRGSVSVPMLFEPGAGEITLDAGGTTRVIRVKDEDDPYRLEVEAFSRAVLGENAELIPLEDSLRNLELLARILKK